MSKAVENGGLSIEDAMALGDLFSEGPVVVFKWLNAKNWPVATVSANVATVFGHTSREFCSGAIRYAQVIHPDDLKRLAMDTAKASAAGHVNFTPHPYRIIHADGTARWIESHVRLVRDENDIITHYIGYVIDVTTKRETEHARRESEARYRTMLNTSPQGYWLIDDDAMTVEVNAAMCKMLGYEADEIVGTSPFDYLTDESREAFRKQTQLRTPGDQRTYQLTARTKDGHLKKLLVHATTLPESITSARSFGLMTDLTDILETQQTLSTLWHALEQSPVGIIITDAKGAITYANPYFTTMTGFETDEVLGHNPRILKSGRTDPNVYEDLWESILNGQIWRGDLVNSRKSGELYWERQTIAPVLGDNGEIRNFVAFKEDVSAYKNAMEAQVRAKEEAELANHAKSIFLANMSHELRTPLNAIIGFSEMMKSQMQGELPEPYMEYTHLIHDSGTHLLSIIKDILDMTRVEADQIELEDREVLLDNLVFECVTLLGEKARLADVEVQNTVGANIRLCADPLRLKQILLNVLSNAIRFSPGASAQVQTSRRFGRFAITVADTGRGMTAQEVTRALKPFGHNREDAYRAQGQGLGLGLPITRRLVEAHGGSLEIESAPGQGTAVHIMFPPERVIGENGD